MPLLGSEKLSHLFKLTGGYETEYRLLFKSFAFPQHDIREMRANHSIRKMLGFETEAGTLAESPAALPLTLREEVSCVELDPGLSREASKNETGIP